MVAGSKRCTSGRPFVCFHNDQTCRPAADLLLLPLSVSLAMKNFFDLMGVCRVLDVGYRM